MSRHNFGNLAGYNNTVPIHSWPLRAQRIHTERLPPTSRHACYSIDPRDSHHLRRERVSIRSLVDLPPTTKRSDSVQRTVHEKAGKAGRERAEHTIFCVERPQQWPLLRSIRAMVGFVCGLPSAPARRTCCIVCRIIALDWIRVDTAQHSSASDTYGGATEK